MRAILGRTGVGKIETALLSMTDKTNLKPFAQGLSAFGVRIISTGGTAAALRATGIAVTEISDYTGFPEIMAGRVKTLHPKVHGGILWRRDEPDDRRIMAELGIRSIDLVAVNLYAFEKTVAKPGVSLEEAVENIDIGGPTLLRAAAKNFKDVTVVVDPADYARVLREMKENDGATTLQTRFELARKVFRTTQAYDAAISGYLERVTP